MGTASAKLHRPPMQYDRSMVTGQLAYTEHVVQLVINLSVKAS